LVVVVAATVAVVLVAAIVVVRAAALIVIDMLQAWPLRNAGSIPGRCERAFLLRL
jgi:hypothetical protein